MEDEKESLIEHVQSILGYSPLGIRELLKVLAYPEVIEYTKKYIAAMDKGSLCTKYKAPWSCAREAEAKYKNIKYGWLGGGGIGFDESWCEPCRKKVMGT